MLKLLRILIAGKPQTFLDVQERVRMTFPQQLDVDCLKKVSSQMQILGLTSSNGGTMKKIHNNKMNDHLSFSIKEFQTILQGILTGKNSQRVDVHMTVVIIVIMEFVAEHVFELAGNYVNNLKNDTIIEGDIKVAINADKVLLELLFPDENSEDRTHDHNENRHSSIFSRYTQPHHPLKSSVSLDHGTSSGINGMTLDLNQVSHSHNYKQSSDVNSTSMGTLPDGSMIQQKVPIYEDVVRELIADEKAFLNDIRLITRLFRDTFKDLIKESESSSAANSLPSSPTSLSSPTSPTGQWSVPSSPTHKTGVNAKISEADIDVIFSNISDIEENSINLLCGVEDALEAMTSSDDPVNSSDRSPKSGIESIGAVFEELAEAAEFDVFRTFGPDVMTYRSSTAYSSSFASSSSLQNPNSSSSFSSSSLMSSPASTIVVSKSTERLNQLLSDPWITNTLSTGGQGLIPAVKYVLPKLLNGIVYHAFTYFEYITLLKKLSPSEEDRESFKQAEGLLAPLKTHLEHLTNKKPGKFGQDYLRLSSLDNKSRGIKGKHVQELIDSLEGIEPTLKQQFSEFLHDGLVNKQTRTSPRPTQRRAFLFDGALLLCKGKKGPLLSGHQSKEHELRVKEQFPIKKLDVIDVQDTVVENSCNDQSCNESVGYGNVDRHAHSSNVMNQLQNRLKMMSSSSWGTSTTSLASSLNSSLASSVMGGTQGLAGSTSASLPPNLKYAFEVRLKDSPPETGVILSCPSYEEKYTWMSFLVFLSNKSLLERRLKSFINDEAEKNPLQIPNPDVYVFAQPDSRENIQFHSDAATADTKSHPAAESRFLQGATLVKLVERLTYHKYPDPGFVRIFLTTYRTFCTAHELLDLLIKRFKIPDIESKSREGIKRFEKHYVQPVQMRVLNVIRQWVDQHYYDFARDVDLETKMITFLEESNTVKRSLKKYVDSIMKTISKKRDFNETKETRAEVFTFNGIPPQFEHWIAKSPEEYNLLTIHPIEFARQLTLYEYDLFKRVKPSELVSCAWTKKDKEKKSANLRKMIEFSTNFTYFLEQQIVETKNFEERVAVFSRILEIMLVLRELNNLNGVLEIQSAMYSSAVFRLSTTKKAVNDKLIKALEDANDLTSDHHKKYKELLGSINPPCVPFLGMYLTHIMHIEEGNSDDIIVELTDTSSSQTTSVNNSCSASPAPSGQVISPPASACVSPSPAEAVVEKAEESSGATNTIKLINFYKRRKVAEITGEIQQYQNTPYCLTVHKGIRTFIQNIDPIADLQSKDPKVDENKWMNEIPALPSMQSISREDKNFSHKMDTYFYLLSTYIEPKNAPREKLEFERKWPELNLKSPGIKPSRAPANVSTLSRARTPFVNLTGSSTSSGASTVTASVDSQAQISPTPIQLSHHRTPTDSASNPTTPLSPTAFSGPPSDHSVFASVMIGGHYNTQPPLSPMPLTPTTPSFAFPLPSSPSSGYKDIVAPPLPPRNNRLQRGTSCESESSPPPLPPKGAGPSPRGMSTSTTTPLVNPISSFQSHPNHHPLHFPFQRNNSFSTTSPGSLGSHHHRQTSQGSPASNHNSPHSHGIVASIPAFPLSLRRNSAMEFPLASAPSNRRHSSTTSVAPPSNPPPLPPPLKEGMEELPLLPPRTYKLSTNSSIASNPSPDSAH
jgi:hypothetical protein